MLRVLNLTEEGRFAGPHKRICEVAVQLEKDHDIETIVLFSRYQSEKFQKILKDNNISFYDIKLHRLTKNFIHSLGYLIFFIPEILKICRIIKYEKPDLIHCNGSYQVKGIIAARLMGTPEVWHMADTYIPYYIRWLFRVVFKLFSSRNFIFASNRTKEYYFPSQEKIDELSAYALIPAPVDTDRFSPLNECVVPYSDNFQGIRVLTVGNVNANKNHKLYLLIADAFQKQYPHIKIQFYIAGAIYKSQKSLYQSLCDLIEKKGINNVVFLGERHDIRELIHHANIFVCPSAFEASPIAVWEALAMAKPVLSTDVGDVSEIFNKYKCGLVGDKDDPEGMAALLERMITNEDKMKEMSQNARIAAIDAFGLKKCAQRHATFYNKIIKREQDN